MLTRDSQHQVPILYREQAREKGQKWKGLSHLCDGEGTKGRGSTFESQLQSWFLSLSCLWYCKRRGTEKEGVKMKTGNALSKGGIARSEGISTRECCWDPWTPKPAACLGGWGAEHHLASVRMCSENRKSGPFWCLQNYMSSGVFVASSEVCGGGSENKIGTIQQTRGSHACYELKDKWIHK